jgi:hypothetical protein
LDVVQPFHGQLIQTTLAQILKEELEQSKDPLGFFYFGAQDNPITQSPVSSAETIDHVEALQKLGSGTMVFREQRLQMLEYLQSDEGSLGAPLGSHHSGSVQCVV